MKDSFRIILIRKKRAPAPLPAKTADEISREMSVRARKILAGEAVESNAKRLNSY